MKLKIIILVCTFLNFQSLFAQTKNHSLEYENIISEIKEPCEILYGSSFTKEYKKIFIASGHYYYFVDYVLGRLIMEPLDSSFISNRRYLKSIPIYEKTDSLMSFMDTLNENKIELTIKKSSAIFKDRIKVVYLDYDSISFLETLDNRYPYGVNRPNVPLEELNNQIIFPTSSISFKVGEKQFSIPDSAYSNLFSPNFDTTYLNLRPVEAYFSPDNKFIYLYIFGSSVDINEFQDKHLYIYMAKLIFSINSGYVGEIIANETSMEDFNCKCRDFIGF